MSQGSSKPYLAALLADSIPESQEGNRASGMGDIVMQKHHQSANLDQTQTADHSPTSAPSFKGSGTPAKAINYFLQKPIFPNTELGGSVFI